MDVETSLVWARKTAELRNANLNVKMATSTPHNK